MNCLNYMKLFGIKSVHYSNENGELITEKIKTMESEHLSVAHKRFLGILPISTNKQNNIKPMTEILKKIHNIT
jgi:hypothetical protein